jgi:hypothetical protein
LTFEIIQFFFKLDLASPRKYLYTICFVASLGELPKIPTTGCNLFEVSRATIKILFGNALTFLLRDNKTGTLLRFFDIHDT